MRSIFSPIEARVPSRYVRLQCRSASGVANALQLRWRGVTRLRDQELGSRLQIRGAKRKSIVTVKSVPQGIIPQKELRKVEEDDGPIYSSTIQQHLNHMRKFSDCVVLTRMGNFYELYFEQAEEYAALLNLKLAKKPTNRNSDGFIWMAGFPFHQKDRFLKILVNDLGKHVAISEEVRNDDSQRIKSGGNLFDRKVLRIITPGTLIDEKFMDPWENNFLLSVHADIKHGDVNDSRPTNTGNFNEERTAELQEIGLAWVDLSSGDFFTQKTDIASLSSVIARIGPREVIIDRSLENVENVHLLSILREGSHSISYSTTEAMSTASSTWESLFKEAEPKFELRKFSDTEIAAGKLLLQYVTSTQLEQNGAQLQAPVQRSENECMLIDKHSLRGLEITTTIRDGTFKGSLLHAIRRTVTQSGARLLSQRLKAPSMSLEEINERLDLAQEMLDHPILRQDIVSLLRSSFDTLRIVSKFAWGRGDADDLLSLSGTISITSQIAEKLHEHASIERTPVIEISSPTRSRRGRDHVRQLLSRLSLEGSLRLANRIAEAIDEERLSEQHRIEESEEAKMLALAEEVLEHAGEEGLMGVPKSVRKAAAETRNKEVVAPGDIWIMRRTASPRLSTLHKELDKLFAEKDEMEKEWQDTTGAKTLALKWIQPYGHVVHVTGVKNINVDFSVLGKTGVAKSGKATKSFYHSEWTHLAHRIEKAKELARIEEQRVFDALRKQVITNLVKLRRNAAVLDELDVACGFATLAKEKRWVRPLLNHSTTHRIIGGRHPTVEAGLTEQGKRFTPNDCMVGDEGRILLITGPNMGGKSTFLRQTALLSILAQTGSFVPADYAEIGIVDKVFSRVGSADNLYQDQSTFMVEMLETAEILKQATPKSFVIMDEVGRGTTPEDGLAVGFATLSHLHYVNQSRTLFATHFHTLADMTRDFEHLSCYCTDVAEEADGSFSYIHQVRKGVNRDSHALKVARLAGMPQEAINIAARVLGQLKDAQKSPPALEAAEKLAASG